MGPRKGVLVLMLSDRKTDVCKFLRGFFILIWL